MALCPTCDSLNLALIFSSVDVGLPTNTYSDSRYLRHDHVNGFCFRHSDNISKIQDAACAGCGLCRLMFDEFNRKQSDAAQEAGNLPIILAQGATIEDEWNDPPQFSPHIEPKLRAFFMSPVEGLISLCDLDLSIDRGISRFFESVHVFPNILAPASGNIPADLPFRPFSKLHCHSDDPSCTSLASGWLSSCQLNHDCPAPNLTSSRLLTRFIDVGDTSTNPRLVEFSPGKLLQPWIALSYRWGRKGPSLRLNKGTEASLKKGVEVSALDAIVQDATTISRRLGVRYLWVDALCIFQDRDSDWLEQSSQMSNIYGQSTITIASVDTDDSSQSFLRPRETQFVGISWTANPNRNTSEKCRDGPQIYISQSWPVHRDLLNGPWSTRAWTLQEGLMPNRILFYSSHQIVWKCCSMVRYERARDHKPLIEFGLGTADEPGGRSLWQFDLFTKFKLLSTYLESVECRTIHDRYRIWYAIVEDYSARHMTYLRDRLIAVSGIAKMYGTALHDERYVAGLWQSDMLPGLLWYAEGIGLLGDRRGQSIDEEVRAPSWSWATAPPGYAIRNDWVDKSFSPLARLVGVSFDRVESSSHFSRILNAKVTVHGPVYRFSQLYHPAWRSASSNLSAFLRHLSRVIEFDYGDMANEFSHLDHYAALLLLREFPTLDHRVDALILRTPPSHKEDRSTTLERLGVLKLSFSDIQISPSLASIAKKAKNKSLDRRLNPFGGARRSKRISCKEFFREYETNRWPCELVTIV